MQFKRHGDHKLHVLQIFGEPPTSSYQVTNLSNLWLLCPRATGVSAESGVSWAPGVALESGLSSLMSCFSSRLLMSESGESSGDDLGDLSCGNKGIGLFKLHGGFIRRFMGNLSKEWKCD